MKKFTLILVFCLTGFVSIFSTALHAQSTVNRDTIILAAREIIGETTYCGLITLDSTGQPQVRTMNPFPLGDDLTIWFATSRNSRKVKEIMNNPNVIVYFADHVNAKGYVNIIGKAVILDDKELLMKMKRGYWDGLPDWQNIFVLIRIVPESLEIINYKHGINNDPLTFKAPSIVF